MKTNLLYTALKALPIIQGIIRGEELQMNSLGERWEKPCEGAESRNLARFVDTWRIKPPAEFPEPPEGEEWHNPDKATAKQIGVDKGYRLLLKSEVAQRKAIIKEGENIPFHVFAYEASSGSSIFSGDSQYCTYFTKHPLPEPELAKELTVAEIEKRLGYKIKVVK